MADNNNNNNNNNTNETNSSGGGGGGSNITNNSSTSSTTTSRINAAAGVLIRTLRKGNGIYPQQGDRCTVHYEGYLEDGTMFETSKKKSSPIPNQSQPIQFMLGMGHVIEGWDAAVARMTKHQIAEVTIPHLFAYGEQGYPPKIPPRSTLIFKLELVDFTSPE
mmetsp:Transcript_17033/g.26365  ORF Transcript_17033/g.26365 Transcript_17033/m.26365 type:complete len:163 (-) Transcript_17033:412-900(-)